MARNGTNYDLLLQSSGAISFQGSIRNTNKVIPNYKSNVESGALGKAKLNIDILLLIKELLHHLTCIINLVAHKSSDKHGCPTTCVAEIGAARISESSTVSSKWPVEDAIIATKEEPHTCGTRSFGLCVLPGWKNTKTGTCRASHLFLLGDFHLFNKHAKKRYWIISSPKVGKRNTTIETNPLDRSQPANQLLLPRSPTNGSAEHSQAPRQPQTSLLTKAILRCSHVICRYIG